MTLMSDEEKSRDLYRIQEYWRPDSIKVETGPKLTKTAKAAVRGAPIERVLTQIVIDGVAFEIRVTELGPV